ncbi:5-oxoprolinase subunit PxpB [Jiulongibacter sediminis]|jgi:inhibitor of KinA|uniref:5-oxoprolinase subunit PxpB n=1 Tax=Jiulongibacter sediminis TaxID=1605367 RepID=UPI0026EBCBC8|nr:5-oxoprolinase subunit PxpB [Jiulongibacter sediminis]
MNYRIHPLSENAITLYFEQKISPDINDLVIASCLWIEENSFPGFIEVVPAYASLTIFYDLIELINQGYKSPFLFVKSKMQEIPFESLKAGNKPKNLIEIPVEYSGEDLQIVGKHSRLSEKEIIKLHTEPEYRVYMMGFLPGFAYMGGLNQKLATPRKKKPRLKVPAGSVGIAGAQTGIYPLESPGGWQLIGLTDKKLFDPSDRKLSLLSTGDYVKFKAV